MLNRVFLLFVITSAVVWHGQVSSQSYPVCMSASSDPDADGFGWENNQTCTVSAQASASAEQSLPVCASASSDVDGDGFGWENNQSCTVTSSVQSVTVQSTIPDSAPAVSVCEDIGSDLDGDGWGWENQRSCVVVQSPNDTVDVIASESSNVAVSYESRELPVGILYFLWHCISDNAAHEAEFDRLNLARLEELNITHVLNGEQSDWGNIGTYHWWDEPAEGYYCLGDRPDIIRLHLEQLRDAGVDYLVLDITNHPNTQSLEADTFIFKTLRPLLEMARTVPDAPRIVPWLPFTSENESTRRERDAACNADSNGSKCYRLAHTPRESMHRHVTDLLYTEFPDLVYQYKGKPLLLETANDDTYPRSETDIVRAQLDDNWTIRRMWGLSLDDDEWQFLTTCSNPIDFFDSKGWTANGCNQQINAGEQISVTAAYQYTYISEPFREDPQSFAGYTGGMPKFQGRTLAQQFRVAFDNRAQQPMVLLTGWNEWIASRHNLEGDVVFVDAFDNDLNRDIEPGGKSGDFYYYLMRDLITQYRNNKPFAFEDYFLTPKSIFDSQFYWETYTDLQEAFAAHDTAGLLNHWLTNGIQEGRRPSVLFDADYYLNRYPRLANEGLTTPEALLRHFIDSGFQDGQQASAEFHAPTYIQRNPLMAELFGDNGYYKAYKYYLDTGLLSR